MMVGVDESGGNDFVGAIDHFRVIGVRNNIAPDLLDNVAVYQDVLLGTLDMVFLVMQEDRASSEEHRGHSDGRSEVACSCTKAGKDYVKTLCK
jgi:hypothetical protein